MPGRSSEPGFQSPGGITTATPPPPGPTTNVTKIELEKGEEVFLFQKSPPRNLSVTLGSSSEPDASFGSAVKISRTLNILESSFIGDGADGLAALAAVTDVEASSQAQGIGLLGGATTKGTYLGERSHADAIGGYFVGVSGSTSTRSGQGIFANGRRENTEGVACGNETVCDNETLEAGVYNKEGASNTRGIWLHPIGTADSACGLQIGHTTPAAHWRVGIGINVNSVVAQSIRDDSESETSIQINGTHSKASLAVASGAGQVIIGALVAPEAGPLFVVYSGVSTIDPLMDFGSGAGTSFSVRFRNASGQMKMFVSNAVNQYLTGTIQGDTGINFTPGKIFHIGAQTKTSLVRVSETGIGFYGHAPIAQQARPPESNATKLELSSIEKLNTTVEAIRKVLFEVGITA